MDQYIVAIAVIDTEATNTHHVLPLPLSQV